jgi:hypothetical protein
MILDSHVFGRRASWEAAGRRTCRTVMTYSCIFSDIAIQASWLIFEDKSANLWLKKHTAHQEA